MPALLDCPLLLSAYFVSPASSTVNPRPIATFATLPQPATHTRAQTGSQVCESPRRLGVTNGSRTLECRRSPGWPGTHAATNPAEHINSIGSPASLPRLGHLEADRDAARPGETWAADDDRAERGMA